MDYQLKEFDDLERGNTEPKPRPQRLSLEMIIRRHLPPDAIQWDHERIVTEINKITHLRLDRENIRQIDSLELLGNCVTNVYLQRNRIQCIENLECLQNISFLMLAGNQIKRIHNLTYLPHLAFLDLSENEIDTVVDLEEFPKSLLILNLQDNPCSELPGYRNQLIQHLPKLRNLNGDEVTVAEKREAGYIVSSDEEDEDSSTDEEESDLRVDSPIKGVFKNLTSEILLRSQSRLEEVLKEHKQHNATLDDIRSNSVLLPERSQLGSRSSDISNSRPPSSISSSSAGSRLGYHGSPLPPIVTRTNTE